MSISPPSRGPLQNFSGRRGLSPLPRAGVQGDEERHKQLFPPPQYRRKISLKTVNIPLNWVKNTVFPIFFSKNSTFGADLSLYFNKTPRIAKISVFATLFWMKDFRPSPIVSPSSGSSPPCYRLQGRVSLRKSWHFSTFSALTVTFSESMAAPIIWTFYRKYGKNIFGLSIFVHKNAIKVVLEEVLAFLSEIE